jgi:D-alanine-D-alanine ligase
MKRVTVLVGGYSAEREVSLASGTNCAAALKDAGYDVRTLDVTGHIRDVIDALLAQKPDVVFNALHGRHGEDGDFQGLLNLLKIPYTHSGVMASALAMDKPVAKRIFAANGLRCPEGIELSEEDFGKGDPLPRPYVVKPANEGSSVGVTIVRPGDNTDPLTSNSWPKGDRILCETYIPGRELTVGVMGDRAMAVTELRPKAGFYDYTNKYTDGKTEHLCPAPLPKGVYDEAMRMALIAYRSLGCRGVARADFRWDDSHVNGHAVDGLYLLEINTQPGMTALSLVPEQARYLGISYPELVAWMVEHAAWDE